MKISLLLAVCLAGFISMAKSAPRAQTPAPTLAELNAKQKQLESTIDAMTTQIMQAQLFLEERIRSDGSSGIKAVRLYHEGTSAFYEDNHIGNGALSMHDHANYDRTVGLGEFVAVMNGVEFRTRHNDYKLRMPLKHGKYHETEYIPFPDVPPSVLRQGTVQKQVEEMQEYFRAFRDQNVTHRDYRDYFKANLCVAEGSWTLSTNTLNEPFQSDRHHIDATSWQDLQDKVRFTSYTGTKSRLENFSWLPTKFYGQENGVPKVAQWNYRIICNPIGRNLPTSYFQQQDDLAHRLSRGRTLEEIKKSRAARFKLNEFSMQRSTVYTLLDQLMAQFPGLNNFGANLTDIFPDTNTAVKDVGQLPDNKVLNTGYYHRWFKTDRDGAMGLSVSHRGYNDKNLWVAFNTQPNVMPLSAKSCSDKWHCLNVSQRVSYAIPLEIIYMTPLLSWNPHHVAYTGTTPSPQAAAVTANGRNGGIDKHTAYNGTHKSIFYRTPADFYATGKVEADKADTAKGSVGVLDKQGNVHSMASSGVRVLTPSIGGNVGQVRTRYPIFPVHAEGSSSGVELSALKEMVMHMRKYADIYETPPLNMEPQHTDEVKLAMRPANKDPPGRHFHVITLTPEQHRQLVTGSQLTLTTSFAAGHSHKLVAFYDPHRQGYFYRTCDGQPNCWDGHQHNLERY